MNFFRSGFGRVLVIVVLIVALPIIFSFGKPKVKYASDKDLIGIWVPAEDSVYLKRVKGLPKEGFFIEFKENGELFLRQVQGSGCGNCHDYNEVEVTKSWCRLNDSIIHTPREYWGNWWSDKIIIQKKSRNEIFIKTPPSKVNIMGKTFTVE